LIILHWKFLFTMEHTMTMPLSAQVNIEASAKNIPLSVLIELTHRCNLQCYYCFQKKHPKPDERTTEQWEAAFRDLAAAGTLYLTFSGGEPFLRKDILTLVERARGLSCAVSLITNGTLLTPEIVARMAELSVLDVGVSLHAARPVVHDELTGVPGSFEKTMRGIDLLREAGIKVAVKHTVSTANFGEYNDLRTMTQRLDCLIECESIVFPDTQGGVSCYALTEEQHRTFLTDMGLDTSAFTCSDSRNLHCDAGRSVAGILPNGDVTPCIQLPLVLGNLTEKRFNAIWCGEKAALFRVQEQLLDRACTECDFRYYCGRCHGLAYWEQSAWQAAAPSLCNRARAAAKATRKQA
jgi:radical SAM protein with 4Fe4S-binding SPASM domain